MRLFASLSLCALFAACTANSPYDDLPDARIIYADSGSADGRSPDPDEGLVDIDDGVPPLDAAPRLDSSSPDPDVFIAPVPDDGVPPPDAAPPPLDVFVPNPDAAAPDPDAYLAPDAFVPNSLDVDNDRDGFSENDGDCDDAHATVFPGAEENCLDRLDNNCDGTADFVDPVCAALPNTTITIETQGSRPAMLLNVEPYTSAADFGDAWEQSEVIVNDSRVSLTLLSRRYPANAFCGIRLNVTFWTDPGDVDARGDIVGDPNQKLCEVRGGVPTIDQGISQVLIQVLADTYDVTNLRAVAVPGIPGCDAVLVLDETGECDLDLL